MTKTAFLTALRSEIVAAYGLAWAADAAKLDDFMGAAARAIEMPHWGAPHGSSANLTDSPCSTRAWRSIGGKGKVTYKALKALPVH